MVAAGAFISGCPHLWQPVARLWPAQDSIDALYLVAWQMNVSVRQRQMYPIDLCHDHGMRQWTYCIHLYLMQPSWHLVVIIYASSTVRLPPTYTSIPPRAASHSHCWQITPGRTCLQLQLPPAPASSPPQRAPKPSPACISPSISLFTLSLSIILPATRTDPLFAFCLHANSPLHAATPSATFWLLVYLEAACPLPAASQMTTRLPLFLR